MMHPHSPSPPQLAIPGIGFPQNFSVGPEVLDPAAFRDWSDDQFAAPTPPIDRIAWYPPVVCGPMVRRLLSRAGNP
jgi:hypothetical protein